MALRNNVIIKTKGAAGSAWSSCIYYPAEDRVLEELKDEPQLPAHAMEAPQKKEATVEAAPAAKFI